MPTDIGNLPELIVGAPVVAGFVVLVIWVLKTYVQPGVGRARNGDDPIEKAMKRVLEKHDAEKELKQEREDQAAENRRLHALFEAQKANIKELRDENEELKKALQDKPDSRNA